MKVRKLYIAVMLLLVSSLVLSSCAAFAPAATSTPLPPTKTPKPSKTPTSTPKPTKTPLPTATPNLAPTQRVDDFAGKIKEYYDAGYISTTSGGYSELSDINKEWKELSYYQWWDTGYKPTNFVINTDVAWNSASTAADTSGCGFVFRIQDNYDHYMLYLSLKGYVEMATNINHNWNGMGIGTFGNPAVHGKATLTLIVEGKIFHVLVNDRLIKTYTGFDGKLTNGALAYTVLSGTNKSYGTNCVFTHTVLWTIQN